MCILNFEDKMINLFVLLMDKDEANTIKIYY